jgi:hypothetical protein
MTVVPPPPAGPYVAMAVFCQRLDRQPDGTVDVIGVVDGVRVSPPGHPPTAGDASDPSREPAMIRLLGLVSVRAGAVRGRHVLSLKAHFPSGEEGAALTRPVELTDRAPGATMSFPLELEAREAGLYWFDVFFDDRPLTRIPLIVEHE